MMSLNDKSASATTVKPSENKGARSATPEQPITAATQPQRFAERLRQQQERAPVPDKPQPFGNTARQRLKQDEGSEGKAGDFALFSANNAVNLASGHADIPVSQPAELDPQMVRQLDRIAAAIAEHAARGDHASFTLQLPGNGTIESAILARNALGAISVTLIASPNTLSSNDRRMLRRELDERLKSRPIKLGEILFAEDRG